MGKISLSNIVEELAVKSGLTREVSDNFMRAFFETIEKGLQEDNLVKIKGLGTFKLQEVSDRGSVDVNTGERITIKGYRKVTFTPESAMKEFVNRPFAHFEPTELSDQYPTDEESMMDDSLDGNDDTEVLDKTVETTQENLNDEVVTEEIVKSTETDTIIVEEKEDVLTDLPVLTDNQFSRQATTEESDTIDSANEIETNTTADCISETEESVKSTEVSDTIAVMVEQTEALDVENGEFGEPQTVNVAETHEAIVPNENAADKTEEQSATTAKDSSSSSYSNQNSNKRFGCGWIITLLLIVVAVGACYLYFTRVVGEVQSHKGEIEEYDDMMVNPNLQEELGESWGGEPEVKIQLPIEKKDSLSQEGKSNTSDQGKSTSVRDHVSPETKQRAAEPLGKEEKKVSESFSCIVEITEALSAKSIKDITPSDTIDYAIEGTLVTHELKSGETIISLARKYYGDKRLWPYIVKYNWMKDYNNVAVGQMINIPILKNKSIE